MVVVFTLSKDVTGRNLEYPFLRLNKKQINRDGEKIWHLNF